LARYYPFGHLFSEWGTIPTDKRYTGQQREYETGANAIYDYGARMYDAKIGRFLQPDPVIDPYDPQSLNRYSYVRNNPTSYTDPTGMCVPGVTCPPGVGDPAEFDLSAEGGDSASVLTVRDIEGLAAIVSDYNFAQHMANVYCVDLGGCNPYGGLHEDSLPGLGLAEFSLLMGLSGRWAKAFNLSTASVRSLPEIADVGEMLEAAAKRAAAKVGEGSGHVHGTRVHTAFKEEVKALGNSDIRAEVSFLGKAQVQYGTAGSVRPDVVLFSNGRPVAVFELKTGGATLGEARIQDIHKHVGRVPVVIIRP
jgi:RHS repeat-associated protein